jgi:hypothetical protein
LRVKIGPLEESYLWEAGNCCVYPEEVKAWRLVCERANDGGAVQRSPRRAEAQADKRRIRELEGELRRKEKALAEAAALLVLRKKAQAIWGEGEAV